MAFLRTKSKGGRDYYYIVEVPYGQKYCEAHKAMHPEEQRSAAGRGYGRVWQKARQRYLETHPFCVECMKEGRYVKAGDRR